MELNANSGGRRHPANVQEKWMQNIGEMPWNRGDPSSDVAIHFLFQIGRKYGIHAFFIAKKEF